MKYFLTIFVVALCVSCSETEPAPIVDAGNEDLTQDTGQTDQGLADVSPTPDNALRHEFGLYELEGGEEIEHCVQWTLDNEKALYVNSVTLGNEGSFHHSNWLVVPESLIEGEDGYFDCSSRGWNGLTFATQGTVLFAQSTQSREEVQTFPEGIAIKIPPKHRVVAQVHNLNLSPKKIETNLRMQLDLLHPKDVKTVVAPLRLSYINLDIQPKMQTRFSATCDFKKKYENSTQTSFDDVKIYWSLPHYHELGNYFSLSIVGGENDGKMVHELSGFNAEANGKMHLPAIEMKGATGLRFSCGYNNPRDENVGFGIGDQEMCVMLGFMDAGAIIDGSVLGNALSTRGDDVDGIAQFEGKCAAFTFKKNERQSMPSQEEIDAPLYIPESSDFDNGVVVLPECKDEPGKSDPKFGNTLTDIRKDIFEPGCTFSSCHDAENPAFGLNLESDDGLHQRLINHTLQSSATMPLLTAGNPAESWLFETLSKCDPGNSVSRMPKNSPVLLEPGLVGMVRDWIEAGAKND